MVWFFMLVLTRRCQLGSISQEPRCEPLVLTLQIKYPHNTKITNIGRLLKIWIEPKRLSRWFFKKITMIFKRIKDLTPIYTKVIKKIEKNQIIGQNIVVFFMKIVGPSLRFFEITKTSDSLIQWYFKKWN